MLVSFPPVSHLSSDSIRDRGRATTGRLIFSKRFYFDSTRGPAWLQPPQWTVHKRSLKRKLKTFDILCPIGFFGPIFILLRVWDAMLRSKSPIFPFLTASLTPRSLWLIDCPPHTKAWGRRPGFSAYFHTNRICPGSFIFPLLVRKVVKFLTITTCQFKWMNGKHLAWGTAALLSSNIDC